MKRRASCTCGQLAIECEGDPVRISVCHCLNCQRRSGGVFAVQARFPRERVTTSGRATEYVLVGDSGGRATFRFCPTCGASVWYDADGIPGFVSVPVGAFADPTFPAPTVMVYEGRRHSWVQLPDSIERLG
jgi:hypothetical protein